MFMEMIIQPQTELVLGIIFMFQTWLQHTCWRQKKLLGGMASQSLNLGTGKGTSVKEIIEATEEILGRKLNVSYVGRRAGDPAELTASSKQANEFLGGNQNVRY